MVLLRLMAGRLGAGPCKVLIFEDIMAVAGALHKGRSSSYWLLQLLRK